MFSAAALADGDAALDAVTALAQAAVAQSRERIAQRAARAQEARERNELGARIDALRSLLKVQTECLKIEDLRGERDERERQAFKLRDDMERIAVQQMQAQRAELWRRLQGLTWQHKAEQARARGEPPPPIERGPNPFE